MATISVKSHAKINICLSIEGKLENGYHKLDMVTLPLELHDSIILTEVKKGMDNLFSMDDFSSGFLDYNIVIETLNKFAKKYTFENKFTVHTHKVVPMEAGLGGGSSNAAFTIKAVNKYLNIGATDEELIELTKDLGADIPFFIKCVPSRCRGIGEKIEPITVKNKYYVLIVKPNIGCPTREVYELADTMDIKTGNVDDVVRALEEGDDELLKNSIFNSLEAPAISLVPQIQEIKDKLKDLGLDIVMMTGSGSAVFALSTDRKKIKNIAKLLGEKYQVIFTKLKK